MKEKIDSSIAYVVEMLSGMKAGDTFEITNKIAIVISAARRELDLERMAKAGEDKEGEKVLISRLLDVIEMMRLLLDADMSAVDKTELDETLEFIPELRKSLE